MSIALNPCPSAARSFTAVEPGAISAWQSAQTAQFKNAMPRLGDLSAGAHPSRQSKTTLVELQGSQLVPLNRMPPQDATNFTNNYSPLQLSANPFAGSGVASSIRNNQELSRAFDL